MRNIYIKSLGNIKTNRRKERYGQIQNLLCHTRWSKKEEIPLSFGRVFKQQKIELFLTDSIRN